MRAVAAAPSIGDELAEAADLLARAHEQLIARPLVPCMARRISVSGWSTGPGGWGWSTSTVFGLGEPEFDLATFCVDLRAEASSIRLPVDELVEAVLDGYRAVAGEPDRRRLQVYAVHKRLARVARSATAIRPTRPNGPPVISRHSERPWSISDFADHGVQPLAGARRLIDSRRCARRGNLPPWVRPSGIFSETSQCRPTSVVRHASGKGRGDDVARRE